MIRLDVSTNNKGSKLTITLEEAIAADNIPLKQRFLKEVSPDQLRTLAQSAHLLLYPTSDLETGRYQSLKEIGQHLFHLLFPPDLKQKLAKASSKYLDLFIDDALVWIPWEILHDGEEFFCLQFNMGREVRVNHTVFDTVLKDADLQMNMVIIADPRGDLPKAYQEGVALQDELTQRYDDFRVDLTTTSVDKLAVLNCLVSYHIVHFAGHAIYNPKQPELSGWSLKDGDLTAHEIIQMAGGKTSFPALVFSNACQSGHTSNWPGIDSGAWIHDQAFDLVNAFLRSGARHYLGTFQKVSDSSSLELASAFYSFMMQSCSIGESLRKARLRLLHKFGPDNLIWATYMLYGNPEVFYLKRHSLEKPSHPEPQVLKASSSADPTRSPPQSTHGVSSQEKRPLHSVPSGAIMEGDEGKAISGNKAVSGNKRIMRDLLSYGIRGILLFLFLAAIIFFAFHMKSTMPPTPVPPQLSKGEWEEKKWEIIWKLQDEIGKKFSESGSVSTSRSQPSSGPQSSSQISTEEAPLPMCIMPAISSGLQGIDQNLTARLVEEMKIIWSHQPGYTFLEREHLDFVLNELRHLTLTMSEEQLKFTLRQVLGAKRIIFVRVFSPPSNFFSRFLHEFLPVFSQEKEAFVRFVDTESSAWKASAKMSFRDNDPLDEVGQKLVTLILRDIKERRSG